MDQRLSISLCIVAFVTVLMSLISCGEKPANVVAEIDFSNVTLPDAVAEVSGFSVPEDWGRWTDSNVAPTGKIRFKKPLPTQFALIFTGQTIQGNEVSTIKIGNFQEQFFLKKLKEVVIIDVTLDKPEDTIEVIPADPVSRRKLQINEDSRKLGVGLATLRIEN